MSETIRARKAHCAWQFALALTLAAPLAANGQPGSPAGPVDPALLQARRAALFDRLGTGLAVVSSARLRSIEGDYPQDADYRESNDFFYLTGLESPGSWLVLVARESGADEAILYIPARDEASEAWTGPRLGPDAEAARLTGITDIRPAERALTDIAALARNGGPLFVETPGADTGRCVGHSSDDGTCRPLVEQLPGVALTGARSISSEIAELRLVKDAQELRRMQRAIDITLDAHRAAASAIEPGMWEYQAEATIEYTFRMQGAERLGFPSIVGSGPYSTILHYDRSRRQMEAGDLVVIDIGAEFGYYSADVTRTYPVSGRFTDRQRAIYNLVLGTQQAAIDSIRPGITVARLNEISREYMRANSGDLCGPDGCERYYIHGLAHWLGMDVHDVGDYNRPLEPGMVLTIEPGIYIPGEQLGVRIEDDVLVTPNGHRVMSEGMPRDAASIERAMAGRPQAARALQRTEDSQSNRGS